MAEEKALRRWDPFRELARGEPFAALREFGGFGRLFDELFTERARTGILSPAVDITEAEDHYLVTAEVPGAKRDDLTIEVQENVLTIRGEKRSERDEKTEKGRWLERTYGSFSRSFTLPADADADRVSARMEDGVLKLEIGKLPEAKPQTIAIKG
jgi:HSP20 family protein